MLHFLRRTLSLAKIDPLGGGLRELIETEQQEPITLEDQIDGMALSEQWEEVVEEAEKDPDWPTFSEE